MGSLGLLPSADGRTVYAASHYLTPLSLATLTSAGSGPATPMGAGCANMVQSPDGSRLYARASTGFVLMMPAGYG